MRYYEKTTTSKTGKTFLVGGPDRILQSDESVICWFRPLPDGYLRKYDAGGLPFNELIPVLTQEQKESDDLQNALESQKQTCIQLLNDSEKSVSNDPPYPDDVETWKTARSQWRNILKSDTIQTIPEKPF